MARKLVARLPRTPAAAVIATLASTRRQASRNRRSTSSRTQGPPSMSREQVIRQYADTLNDPFTHGPMRLGWGCLTPTVTATAYYRAIYSANADGSFGLMVGPILDGTGGYHPIQVCTAGHATATWTSVSWSNVTALNASVNSGRCVSVGCKCYPLVASTNAPGVIFAGAVPPETSPSTLGGYTIDQFSVQPYMRWGRADHGALAVGRPADTQSFAMNGNFDAFNPSSFDFHYSIPIIVMTGLPASASVVIECVLNFEGEQETLGSTSFLEMTGQGTNSNTITLSDTFANIEQSFNSVRPLLNPAGHIGNDDAPVSTVLSNHINNARQNGYRHRGLISSAAHAARNIASTIAESVLVERPTQMRQVYFSAQ